MTPTQTIIQAASRTLVVVDKSNRKLVLRTLTALDTLRLFKAAGPILSQNEPWLSMAGLAFSILEIDGVPVPSPINEGQIEGIIDRLGDIGLEAVANAVQEEAQTFDLKQSVGNLPGIPS